MTKKIRAISLFSGAGGLDTGALHAGVHIEWANDAMKEACETYRNNIGDHIVYGDVNQHLDEIKQFAGIDLVIGGPPCQGFSVAGKMDAEDKRSQLVWTYAKIVSIVKPKAFIMENVKALAEISRWKNVREKLLDTFRKEGYSVNFVVLNASDFNVPQARERVFFVGFRDKETIEPNLRLMMEPYKSSSPSVGEVLKQMDRAGTGNNKGVCKAKITLAKKPVLRNSAYSGMLFNGMGRPLDLDGYSATLPASMGGNKTPIVDEKALYEGQRPWIEHYYELVSSNLSNVGKIKVPTYLRRLTLQEAARLQTFPDSYVFSGPQSSAFTQIGNAVPCNLAEAVCKMVVDVITGKNKIIPIMPENEITTLVVDRDKATQILLEAVENAKEIKDELGSKITRILTADEAKAFRYILFTALLAKATDDRVDPLSLQKKDPVPGAYDARTFCKHVVVPFEQREFPNGLGNSADPFVGKPARFARLSYSLPTKTPDIRDLSIEVLSQINNSQKAQKYLKSAVKIVQDRSKSYLESLQLGKLININSNQPELIFELLNDIVRNSFNGETCPIVVATLESLCSPSMKVIPHKVNESGKSTNEVGDIDIYNEEDKLIDVIEVKDKEFVKEDVRLAIGKAYREGASRCMFIYGNNLPPFDSDTKDYLDEVRGEFGRKGTFCTIIQISDYIQMRIHDNVTKLDLKTLVKTMSEKMKLMEVRAKTITWVRESIKVATQK